MEIIVRKHYKNQELESLELIGIYPDGSKDTGKKLLKMYVKAKEKYSPKRFVTDGKFIRFSYYTSENVVSVERLKIKDFKTKINFTNL